MKKQAIIEARKRLEWARSDFQAFNCAPDYTVFEERWISFLQNIDKILPKIMDGARSNGLSRTWANKKRKEQKEDPVLSYLHQACNTEKHGIMPVSGQEHWIGIGSVGSSSSPFTGSISVQDGKITVNASRWEISPAVKRLPPVPSLVPVENTKYGDIFYPPQKHFDNDLPVSTPMVVGMVALEYYGKVLQEADTFDPSEFQREVQHPLADVGSAWFPDLSGVLPCHATSIFRPPKESGLPFSSRPVIRRRA